jgi:hypothetical protein
MLDISGINKNGLKMMRGDGGLDRGGVGRPVVRCYTLGEKTKRNNLYV